MKKVIIIGAIAAVLGTGYFFYRSQIKKLESMKYQFLKVGLTSFDKDTAVLSVTLMVTSTSTLEAQITDLNLDVYFDNVKVGTINEQKPIIIPAKGNSMVDLKVSIPLSNIATNVLGLAQSYFKEKNAAIKINGYGKVKSAFIKTSVPFEYDSTLKEMAS